MSNYVTISLYCINQEGIVNMSNKLTGIIILILSITLGLTLFFGMIRFKSLSTHDVSNQPTSVIPKNTEEEYIPKFVENRGNLTYSPMGDSLTGGYYASTSETKFTSVFAGIIQDKMGFSVTQDGIGNYGGKLEEGLESVSAISEKNPDIVTIEYGTNDSDPNNGNVEIEDFEANLNEMIDGLTDDDPPLIILVTTWNQGEKAIPYDNVIKKVGEERNLPVVDISHIWARSDTKGPAGVETEKGESDNWHPNDLGMELIAEAIFKVAAPYIDKIDE